MANPDLKKFVLKNQLLQWPKLDQTYRFNRSENRSEAVAPTASGATWTCGVMMSTEEARSFYNELKAHYDDCATRKSLPAFKHVFGMKKREDGTVVFMAKKNGTSAKGQQNDAPKVLAGDLTDLQDKRIWSGSKGNVRVLAHPSQNPAGEGGISLLLDTVHVTHAVYGPDEDDFKPTQMTSEQTQKGQDETTPFAAKDDPFGLPPMTTEAQNRNDLEDEIPF